MTTHPGRALSTCIAILATIVSCGAVAAQDGAQSQTPATDSLSIRTPAEQPDPGAEGSTVPEPEGPITFEEALTYALAHSPEVNQFAWWVRAAEGRGAQARKWPNPELDLRVWRLADFEGGRVDIDRFRAIYSQEFEFGGKRRKRMNLAAIDSDLAEWDYDAKVDEISTLLKLRFVELLGAQRRVKSLQGLVQFGETIQGTMQTLVQRQAASQLEVQQVTRQLGMTRIDLKEAEADLAMARFELAEVWGGTFPRFTEARGDLEQMHQIPPVETLLERIALSPEMARREIEVARAQAAISVAKSRAVPDIAIGVGVRRTEGAVSGMDYILDFDIPLPFLDRKQGEIREAKAQASAAASGREVTRAATSRGIAEFYYRMIQSEAAGRTLRDEVLPASRASFEAHRSAFANQVATVDDLLDARRDISRAEINYVDALVDYQQSLAVLEQIVGESFPPIED